MQFDIDVGLPNKWLNCYLGEAIDYGKTKKANMASLDENTWVLELEDIEKNTSKVLQMLTFKERQSKSAKNEFEKGDILYGKLRPYLNKVIIAIENGVCSSEIIPIKCDPSFIEPRFLFYWLKSFEFLSFVNEVSYGVNMPRLGTKDGKKAPFRLAPLSEQKRIVEKLDSLLAQVETIQQRLNNLPDIIKRFRQSVLAAAVSGKLTAQWRVENNVELVTKVAELNLAERKAKLASRVQKAKQCEKPERFNIPKSWSWISIDEGCIKITDGTHHSPVSTPEGDYKYVTSKNVREGYIDLSNIKYVSKEVHTEIYARCDVVKGDVLYVKDGANTGLACVNDFEEEISLLSSVGVMKVASYLDPLYLQHYLNSPIGRKLMLDLMGGTAIKRLTLTKIKVSPLSLPPLNEQTEIVRLVEQYFALADTLEKHLANAKARVDNLTQSILAKAFRGELVPQDPNDEPADKLLERIKAARLEAEKLEKAAKKAAKVKQ
ncbi:type I restriction-modification system restriction endonuclease DNA specificity subunit HsdS [Alteromonas sp. KUL156]|nr:type I restriction-modification system restriction endonuclease DNA specificity subunit HsdS [Alteromonas sp. KUL154]GFD99244.1 type I restriction-modification system restriction endonuclease DNA specificity subunit HsdS [Alteromonas sp. KUL156]